MTTPTITPAVIKTTNSTNSLTARITKLIPDPVLKTPRLYYVPHIWNQIQYIIQASPKEVGWWGLVDKIGDDYIVTALYVPPQEVTGAETDISADAMANLAMEIINGGKDPSQLYYWGHSHVNMQVGPSGQDETQVRDYLQHCPIFIRGIYNKRGDSKVDIYDVEQNTCFESVANMPLHPQLTAEDTAGLDALLASNVKAAVVATYVSNVYGTHYDSRSHNAWGQNQRREIAPLPEVARKTPAEEKPTAKEVGNAFESGFFLVGAEALEYYHALDANDYATLHAHIYN